MSGPATGFETMSVEERYRGPFVRVDEVTLSAPQGGTFSREVLRQLDAAAVLPYDDGDVILLRQYRAAIDVLSIEAPAGLCDVPGEPPEVTARRECAEEVGQLPGRLTPIATIHPAPGYAGERVHVYLGLDLEPRPRAPHGPEEEASEVLRVPLDEALAMVARGEISNATTVVALYGLAARREELLGR